MNYKVYQGEELKQTATSKTAVMNGLQPNKTYDFSVQPDNTQTVGGRTRYTHIAYAYMTHIANENTSFTLSERSTVRFGAGNTWIYKTFDAGTHDATNDTFGRDPCVGINKSVELVSDFSVGQGSNKTYIGWYSDFNQNSSNDPSQYTWNPNATTSVTTRGIRFNIPKTLTVDSTITLRYEEYPLGIVPIGSEPSGYFGGGNKQNLSAKVISAANGSSVVEVAGNVIEVGGRNLISGSYDSSWSFASNVGGTIQKITMDSGEVALHVIGTSNSSGFYAWFTLPSGDNTTSIEVKGTGTVNALGWEGLNYTHMTPTSNWQRVSITNSFDGKAHPFVFYGAMDVYVRLLKAEKGNTTTPYAAFVDGDTFAAQPDGTCALFSEHKALYY